MRSRFIFIIVLFTLLFNISHDLFIAGQSLTCETATPLELSMQEFDKDECCNEIIEWHEHFHFTAILDNINIEFFNPIQTTLTFVNSISLITVHQTTFRPPIA